jgi:quercetin dioxygenase-like cupin family protein
MRMSLSPTELERFVCRLAEDQTTWQHHVRHDPDARVYEQIWDDDDVNAWIICWSEDQDTGFHDHDESAAAILVLAGQVREERLRVGGAEPAGRNIGPGAPFFVAPSAIHRVLHSGEGPAVTIHAYSPPLRRTGAYQVGPDGELERISQPYEEELQARTVLS